MIVCAHGNVTDFCHDHDMVIVETYSGELEGYGGIFRVLVTDQEMSENEYYFLKGRMLSKGYELVSIHYKDKRCLVDLVTHMVTRETEGRKEKFGGRYKFGMNANGLTDEGRVILKKIFEMIDAGFPLRQISECPEVHHPDGRSISVSTLQVIKGNREIYEEEGL